MFQNRNEFFTFTGNAAERRELAERRRLLQVAEREKLIAAQTSSDRDSRQRIELWERLHGMHLPRTADHTLVRVIARQTALTVQEIHEEQARRVAAANSSLAQG